MDKRAAKIERRSLDVPEDLGEALEVLGEALEALGEDLGGGPRTFRPLTLA